MEESVWIYFGVIAVLITIGIFASIFQSFKTEQGEGYFFKGVEQLGRHMDMVCDSPRETMLSTAINIPAGGKLYVEEDRVCGTYEDAIKCVRTDCPLYEQILVDATGDVPFDTHEFTCAVRKQDALNITCQG